MLYKIVWTVIASLGVFTQVPGMIESHKFNNCIANAPRLKLEDKYAAAQKKYIRYLKYRAVHYCNGGISNVRF